MTNRSFAILMLAVVVLFAPASAAALDPEQTFAKGTFVLSGEGAYGWQFDLEALGGISALEFWDASVRFGVLPFDTIAKDSPLYGAFEIAFGPLYQQYIEPRRRFWAGLTAVLRYHFLGLGRVVPYIELAGSAGGTDLRLSEIRSTFAFLVYAGAGVSLFLSDHTAAYAGYRLQHVSNGNTSQPNRGFESNVAVAGLSLFF